MSDFKRWAKQYAQESSPYKTVKVGTFRGSCYNIYDRKKN